MLLVMAEDRETIRERYGWSSPERRLARAVARSVGGAGGKVRVRVETLADRSRMTVEELEELIRDPERMAVVRRIIARGMYAVRIELNEGVVEACHT